MPLGLEAGTIALFGAAVLTLLSRLEVESVLREVEWPTLFFFVGLFMLVEAVVHVGIIDALAEELIELTGGDATVTTIGLLWLSGVASAIVDNIPYTATMIPVVKQLGCVRPADRAAVVVPGTRRLPGRQLHHRRRIRQRRRRGSGRACRTPDHVPLVPAVRPGGRPVVDGDVHRLRLRSISDVTSLLAGLIPSIGSPAGSAGPPGASGVPLDALFAVFLLFVGAKLGEELARRLHQPAVLGELFGGFVVGTYGLGWVTPDQTAFVLAEIGVVILLFSVGLEVRMDDLLAVGRPAVLTAVLGMVLPISVAVAFGLLIDTSLSTALFIGLALAATSIGITSRVLAEFGVLDRTFARVILGAAVIDDVASLILIGLVSGAVTGDLSASTILVSVAAVGLVGLGFAAARRARGLPREAFTWPMFADTPLAPAFILMFALALVSAVIGLAAIIGAFVAGLIVAETEAREELEHEMRSLGQIFIPFFFAVTGAQLDLGALLDPAVAGLAIALAIIGILTKARRRDRRCLVGRAVVRGRRRGGHGASRRGRDRRREPGAGRGRVVGCDVQRGPRGRRGDDGRRPVPPAVRRAPSHRRGRAAASRRSPRLPPPEEAAPIRGICLDRSPTTHPAQDHVDLVAIRPPDRGPIQPFDVLDVASRDLAERPTDVAAEVEHAARRVAGWRTRRPEAIRRAHRRVVSTALARASGGPVARHLLRRRRRGWWSWWSCPAGGRRRPSRCLRFAGPLLGVGSLGEPDRPLSIEDGAREGIAEAVPRGIERGHPRGGLRTRSEVRVVFAGQPTIGGLDDLVLRLGVDLEDLVRVRRVRHPEPRWSVP